MLSRFNFLMTVFISLLVVHNSHAESTAESSEEKTAEGIQNKNFQIPVTAYTVKKSLLEQHTRVQGIIEAINAPQLKTKISAEVVKINVDEGDSVKAGQTLALLDDEGFRLDKEAAVADIAQLKALLENQQITLTRNQTLFSKKLISQSEVDAASALVKQTRARINHAIALRKKAEYQLSHTRILAPISGVVQERSVSRGDYVNPMSPSSKPLFQIVDTEHLRARLYFPETLAQVIKPGMAVTLKRDAERLAAKISHLRPMLETQNRALHALAEFKNTLQWKPGESLTADVVLERKEDAITVPESALIRRPAGLVVYLLKENKAHEVVVKTGIREGDQIEILSGIQAEEQIALDGAAYLSQGVAVQIQSASRGEQ